MRRVKRGEYFKQELGGRTSDFARLFRGQVVEDLGEDVMVDVDQVQKADPLVHGSPPELVGLRQRCLAALGQVPLKGRSVVAGQVADLAHARRRGSRSWDR